ncbi:hypothetical protein LTR37_017421 [Vermiconidia calcicola]|uniref:Uncharacterized protein n=1 Tax=Vermiconidia calcicola TaxID=1690605 RepID=A0ACC3MJU7_9PEZI|nr:hypothetical protein LTR37_017421 [Vermiconidia calcicola]
MADTVDSSDNMTNMKEEQEQVNVTSNGENNVTAQPDATGDDVKTEAKANGDTSELTKVEATEKKEDIEIKEGAEKKQDLDMKDTEEKSEGDASRSPDSRYKQQSGRGRGRGRGEHSRGRGGQSRGGGDQFRKKNNIKTRFDDVPESKDHDEIRRQVEFYFSDSNLPIDEYLLRITGGSENKPVPLKVIHNFKRMRHFQPFGAVVEAVKESNFLNLNEDNEITRKEPLDAKFTDDVTQNKKLTHTSSMPRSIYAKGFGDEKSSTQLDIEEFFEPYGPVQAIRLRRDGDDVFKGSVFVEFTNAETQQRFLDLDPKPQWDGKDLQIMSKQEYVDIKHRGIVDGLVKPRSPSRRSFNSNKDYRNRKHDDDRRSGGYDRDSKRSKFDARNDNWKEARERDRGYDDRRGRSDRGRGRGGRGGRGGRRDSPDGIDRKKRRRSDEDDREDIPTRAEAEAKRAKREADKGEGQATAGAEGDKEVKGNNSGYVDAFFDDAGQGDGKTKAADIGNAANGEETAKAAAISKKRSRDDKDEGLDEVKKVKTEAVADTASGEEGAKTDAVSNKRSLDEGIDAGQGEAKEAKTEAMEVKAE